MNSSCDLFRIRPLTVTRRIVTTLTSNSPLLLPGRFGRPLVGGAVVMPMFDCASVVATSDTRGSGATSPSLPTSASTAPSGLTRITVSRPSLSISLIAELITRPRCFSSLPAIRRRFVSSSRSSLAEMLRLMKDWTKTCSLRE